VILIVGPRRAGRTYITFGDQTVLEAGESDPAGLIRGLDQATIIDEIQRAPDLLLAIQKTVDEDNRPGCFLLTGSASALTLPRITHGCALLRIRDQNVIGVPGKPSFDYEFSA
jgi:uncharacterized protein